LLTSALVAVLQRSAARGAAAQTTLALPIYPELSSEQLEYVARSVLEYVSPDART